MKQQKRFFALFFLLKTVLLIFFILGFKIAFAQGFLHADGTSIVNGNGEPFLLKGIGTGNWMIMEGYMMKTEGVAGTQHEFEASLKELIGEQKTNEFFDTWLANHFTKTDVDSMKAWGFNSIRVAMHYKWFTLPIEEEPIQGNQTWLLKGFKMIDNLLSWCAQNEMYLILDLHGAPGGQGKNADISDYDPSKPSLWESEANKAKTVALWRKLAERYQNNEWIGGYDLINETNWTFSEPDNQPLRQLLVQITTAIREVDNNHIIFVEGNGFANDHNGLTPPWDNNMVYSFHKYWSGTSSSDIDWMKAIRDEFNVPLWMGESGENSNTWFTEFISTCEENNIGWSWWPVKKNGINNVLFVPMSDRYQKLVKYWKAEIKTKPSATEAFQAVMDWAKNQKIENCRVQRDVIDAMMRQPHTNEVLPYKQRSLNGPIYFSDFDMGKNGIAYFDNDVAHYGGDWNDWNTGWELRNDGVDIEKCTDTETTNGYNVGWAETGEWMQYSTNSDSTALYSLEVRHASGSSGSKFHIEANGAKVSEVLTLPSTSGWQNWKTATFDNVVLPKGNIPLKFVIDKGGSNLNYFHFTNPKSAADTEFKALSARTSVQGPEIYIVLNKDITSKAGALQSSDFTLTVNGSPVNLLAVELDSLTLNTLILKFDTGLYSDSEVKLSYNGISVKSGEQQLNPFSGLVVENKLPQTHVLPGKIEAEDFAVNKGLSIETSSDVNGGKNTGYANAGDYLDYRVHVTHTGFYALHYRVATEYSDAEIIFQTGDGENFVSLDTIHFSPTGGWQSWVTQSRTVRLEEGYYFIRLLIKQGESNLNWFELDLTTTAQQISAQKYFRIYPNPVHEQLTIDFDNYQEKPVNIQIINSQGSLVRQVVIENENSTRLDVSGLKNGMYIARVVFPESTGSQRFIISK